MNPHTANVVNRSYADTETAAAVSTDKVYNMRVEEQESAAIITAAAAAVDAVHVRLKTSLIIAARAAVRVFATRLHSKTSILSHYVLVAPPETFDIKL